MSIPLIHKSLRLVGALALLAALLAIAPGHARAAGAVRCDAAPASLNHALRIQTGDSHQAGLVIDFGDGRVQTYCIDLGDDGQATGEELLRATNLAVIIDYGYGIGGAVCKIDTVGSNFPAEPCFSHCTLQPGQTCIYWVYSQLVGDHWQFLQNGASDTVAHSGDVYGWAWGESAVGHGAAPPLYTLAQICQPATATPTASLTPTPSATLTATQPPAAPPPATPKPYVAPVITSTSTPSATPSRTPTASPVAAISTPTVLLAPAQPTAAQAAAPTVLAESSPTSIPTQALIVPSPTEPSSATPAPPAGAAQADSVRGGEGIPVLGRSAGGALRIQLPLIQYAAAATPSPSAAATAARVETSTAMPRVTPAPPTATPLPARPPAPGDDPTRTYPYFGGTAAFLLAIWVLLRRGRTRGTP